MNENLIQIDSDSDSDRFFKNENACYDSKSFFSNRFESLFYRSVSFVGASFFVQFIASRTSSISSVESLIVEDGFGAC